MSFFDFTVIGSGIIGTSIARKLAQTFPKSRLLLIDQFLAGMGASGFSAGLHLPYGYNSLVKRLSEVSSKEYAELYFESINSPFYPLLFTGVVSNENYEVIASRFYPFLDLPQNGNYLISKNLGEYVPNASQILFPISSAHYADVPTLIKHYLHSLRRNSNVRVWEGTAVLHLFDEAEGVRLSLSDGRTIRSHQVILCPGPWIGEGCFKELLNPFQIRTKKIVAFHIDLKPKDDDRGVFLFDHDAFLLPLYHLGYWLFSFTCQEWDVKPGQSILVVNPEDRECALKILMQHFPDLVPYVNSGRVFCDAYSKDRVPVIAKLSTNSNVIFAGATNGSGYRLAPGIAQEVVKMIV